MKITSETDYAIRIICLLTLRNEKVDSATISENTGVPIRFAHKILRTLIGANIVKSIKGVKGGYMLSKEPKDISLLDVIETIDGKIIINKCLADGFQCTNPKTKENQFCAINDLLSGINNDIVTKFSEITFDIIHKNERR